MRGLLGHHFGYSIGVAEAALALGIEAVVLPSRALRHPLPDGIQCRPSFATSYQSAGQGGRLRRTIFGLGSHLPAPLAACVAPPLRALRRVLRRPAPDGFATELAAALTGLGETSDDLVLLHSVSASNLSGLDGFPATRLGRLVVVLRRTPDDMDRDDPGPEPMGAILRSLKAHFGTRLRLLADTAPLCRLWSSLTGLPFGEVPPPVAVPPVRDPVPADPPHLVFAGGARLEKGYALLPDLVRSIGAAARFTIHSGPIGAGDDPLVQRAHRQLQAMAGPAVGLVERSLSPDDYMGLMRSADLLLLPYDAPTYGPRSSGILSEARAMGVPAVVPRGCWMQDAVGPEPGLAYGSAADLTNIVRGALADLPALLAAYGAAAPAWRDSHSPEALLAGILRA